MRRRPFAGGLSLATIPGGVGSGGAIGPLPYRGHGELIAELSQGAINTRRLALFDGSNKYLSESTANIAGLLSGAPALAIEIWRNRRSAEFGSGACYCACCNYGVSGKQLFAVLDVDGQVVLLLFGNDGTQYALSTTDAPQGWTRLLITGAIGSTTLKFYFDGATTSATTDDGGTALPHELATGQTCKFTLGACGDATSALHDSSLLDGGLLCVRLWVHGFTGAESAAMWHGGLPLGFNELTSAGYTTDIVSSWELTESSGTRFDSVTALGGHNLVEVGDTVHSADAITSITLLDGRTVAPPGLVAAPHRQASGFLTGRVGIYFGGGASLQFTGSDLGDGDVAGDWITLTRPDRHLRDGTTPQTDGVIVSISGEEGSMIQAMTDGAAVLEFTGPGGLNGAVTSHIGLTWLRPNTTNFRGLGGGGAASFAVSINGQVDALATSDSGVQNKWEADCGPLTTITIGAAPDGSRGFVGLIDSVLLYRSLSPSQNAQIDGYENQLYTVPTYYQRADLLRVGFDYADISRMTLEPAVRLLAARSQYLQCAYSTSLAFTTAFSATGARNRDDWVQATDKVFCGQCQYGTNGKEKWWVQSGGSMGVEQQLRVFLKTGASSSNLAAIETTDAPFGWSRWHISYDGSQATPLNRIKVYLDGVLMTTAKVSGTDDLPATLQTDDPAFTVGAVPGLWRYWNGAIGLMAVWKRTTTLAEAQQVYNSGNVLSAAAIKADAGLATNLSAMWDFSETSGTRFDATSNHNDLLPQSDGAIDTTGLVKGISVVREITDLSQWQFEFGASFWQAPYRLAAAEAASGLDSLYYGGMHLLYRRGTLPFAADNVFDRFSVQVHSAAFQPSVGHTLFETGYEQGNVEKFAQQRSIPQVDSNGANGGATTPWEACFIRDDAGLDGNASFPAHIIICTWPTTGLVVGTKYTQAWRRTGSATDVVYINGAARSVSVQTTNLPGNAHWLGAVSAHDIMAMGAQCIIRSAGTLNPQSESHMVGEHAGSFFLYGNTVTDGCLTAADFAAMRSYIGT